MVFSTVWLRKETKEIENRGENFPSGPTFFYPLNLGRKWGGKSAERCTLHKYPQFIHLTYPYFIHLTYDLMTFASSLSLYLHSTATSRFFFFIISPPPPFFYFFIFYFALVELCVVLVPNLGIPYIGSVNRASPKPRPKAPQQNKKFSIKKMTHLPS